MKTVFALFGAMFASGLIECRAQNLLVNGSFESLPHPTNSITSLAVGTTNLPGWTIQGTGSMYLVTTPLVGWAFAALDGRQFIDFNQASITMSQSFATVAGETYEASFTAGRFQGSTNMQVIGEVVSTNGTLLGSTTAGVPQTSAWGTQSRFRFVASDDMATIRFHGTNGTVNVDLAMDAVSVERVTLPLSIATSQVRLCWESRLNRSYHLQYRSDLTTNTWTDLGAPMAGTGTTDCNEQPVTEPQRFFRVVLLP